MAFVDKFRERGNISFEGLRNVAVEEIRHYSIEDKDRLYDELKRGTGILDDEPHLNMYLQSFGKMHMAKLETAYAYIPKMFDVNDEDIEIFDWGCGQGTATLCFWIICIKKIAAAESSG